MLKPGIMRTNIKLIVVWMVSDILSFASESSSLYFCYNCAILSWFSSSGLANTKFMVKCSGTFVIWSQACNISILFLLLIAAGTVRLVFTTSLDTPSTPLQSLLISRFPLRMSLSFLLLVYSVAFSWFISSSTSFCRGCVSMSSLKWFSATCYNFLIITSAKPLLAGNMLCFPLWPIKKAWMNCDTTSIVLQRRPNSKRNSKSRVRRLIMFICCY